MNKISKYNSEKQACSKKKEQSEQRPKARKFSEKDGQLYVFICTVQCVGDHVNSRGW